MITYVKTFGDPSNPQVRTHIENPGMDYTICGLDTAGDELVHAKEPMALPRGKRHIVTCEMCKRIIEAVKEHINFGQPTTSEGG